MLWNDSPSEWQKLIQRALKLRYSHTAGAYQELPDKYRGDAGLEGYATDGTAYQCYSAHEPISNADLHKNQLRKITTDIRKFKNKARVAPLLGLTRIAFWNLVVPRFDSTPLVAHANKKSEEVRRANLLYVAADFQIRILDADHFQTELQQLGMIGLAKIDACETVEFEEAHEDWAARNLESGMIGNLLRKLPKWYENNKPLLERRRKFVLQRYRIGQVEIQRLRDGAPDIFESIRIVKQHRENLLEAVTLTGPQEAPVLTKAFEDLKVDLGSRVQGLTPRLVEVLAWEAVADWVLRCPLEV